jgi:twinkle protein
MEQTDSDFLQHEPCPSCGSKNNLARYTDGHGYCFGCQHHEKGDGSVPTIQKAKMSSDFISGDFAALSKRRITEETCRKFGYRVGMTEDGRKVQLAPYFDKDGAMVAQKVRTASKDFWAIGKLSSGQLFGQRLWAAGGKRIIVCEGEIDAMSASQAQGNKWATVSVPTGSSGAKKALAANLEYLESFNEVVLMFDQDTSGQEAAAECVALFTPGKAKVATLPLKDANDMLVARREDELVRAIWEAKTFRPDGIVTVSDVLEQISKPLETGFPWFLETLTKLTHGRRLTEVYGVGAGTGVGKTDFITQQIAYDVQVLKMKVGVVFLEQQPSETVKRISGKIAGKRFHVPGEDWTTEELISTAKGLEEYLYMYNSFGETDWAVVKAKIRYLAVSEGVQLFYVDHLTAMANTESERESLEKIMKELAGLANALQVVITFVSHLSTPSEGRSHEEGGRVSIKNFKGSRSIGFWSYFMFGLERDQQHEDPLISSTTTFRILKDRFTGQSTGSLIYLAYDPVTGRLSETVKPISKSEFKDETVHQDF